MSSTILYHYHIVFESFQPYSGISIDPSELLSDEPSRYKYEVKKVENKNDPSSITSYEPSDSLSTSPIFSPGSFPPHKPS